MRTACINPKRINQARLAADMSQADVAYRLRQHGHKATERSIRRWETGQHAPHANIVPVLADALGVSIDELYETTGSDDGVLDEGTSSRLLLGDKRHAAANGVPSSSAPAHKIDAGTNATRVPGHRLGEERPASTTHTKALARSTYPGSASEGSQETS